MKYRTGFVTNSSSTSFAAAGIGAALALIATLLSLCSPKKDDPKKDDSANLLTTTMPEGVMTLKCDNNPVNVFGQFVDIDAAGQQKPNAEATNSITFSIVEGGSWAKTSDDGLSGDWKGTFVTATPVADPAVVVPDQIVVRVSGTYNGKPASKNVTLKFEGPPSITFEPIAVSLLSKTGKSVEVKYKMKGGAADTKWAPPTADTDADAAKICTVKVEADADDPTKGKITVTEADSGYSGPATFTDYYSRGLINVTVSCVDPPLKDTVKVTVYRQGLFIDDTTNPREDKDIVIDATMKDDSKVNPFKIVDLCLLSWDDVNKEVKADPKTLQSKLVVGALDFDDDDKAENVFKYGNFKFEKDTTYEGGIRQSNLSTAMYRVSVNKSIPGKEGDLFEASLPVSIDVDKDHHYDLNIPLAIQPQILPGNPDFDKAYQDCVFIINKYMVGKEKTDRLETLEAQKNAFSVEDLKEFRRKTWDTAYDAIMEGAAKDLETAEKWEMALTAAEWVEMLAEKAWSASASLAFGPVGAQVADEVYKCVMESIKAIGEKWNEDWGAIAEALVKTNIGIIIGETVKAGSKDVMKAMWGDPKVCLKWIAQYTVWRTMYHWYMDMDDSGQHRKGFTPAMYAAGKDLSGELFEKAFEALLHKGIHAEYITGAGNTGLEDWMKSKGITDYYVACRAKLVETLEATYVNFTF
jgi:hypothetical protein